ncbi:hypothetical protein ASG49_04705 [Marmoricola sp. Leaf446]|uniref:biotin--[acetyl-CoA-carboxylase] ligase n=1 Tax=Marmoricola sp. Leaf446 TaxID=1736379 RepID=UPI0006F22F99|nr:biotin--[acetyl-CoA-carboxylase] ligase [Marmoricola sp. Leaf446]KQT94206.1 hypothetical protein ASG49_04705 [Marmoricola sp. Leaf446]
MNAEQPRRPPLDAAAVGATGRWRVEVVESSGSTNADVAQRYAAGEAEGLVLVAEHQTAGRGRLGREWVSPARSSLTVSFLLVPAADVAPVRWGWLPLATGLATAAAVRRTTGVDVALKWPNDVLADDGRKLGGILLERVDRDGTPAAVIGIGLNCTQTADELPVPEATSLALAGAADVDRATVLGALVEELDGLLEGWAGGEDLRAAYVGECSTLGREVRVTVPGGEVLGEAVDVDADGQLVVRTASGEQHLGAGDVVHVRPTDAS